VERVTPQATVHDQGHHSGLNGPARAAGQVGDLVQVGAEEGDVRSGHAVVLARGSNDGSTNDLRDDRVSEVGFA